MSTRKGDKNANLHVRIYIDALYSLYTTTLHHLT